MLLGMETHNFYAKKINSFHLCEISAKFVSVIPANFQNETVKSLGRKLRNAV